MMNGSKKNISDYRAFGCLSYVYMTKTEGETESISHEHQKAIHLGFASDHNMSAHQFYCFETKKLILSNEIY
jgi:hypothetical protein